jgi:hypothetical protein
MCRLPAWLRSLLFLGGSTARRRGRERQTALSPRSGSTVDHCSAIMPGDAPHDPRAGRTGWRMLSEPRCGGLGSVPATKSTWTGDARGANHRRTVQFRILCPRLPVPYRGGFSICWRPAASFTAPPPTYSSRKISGRSSGYQIGYGRPPRLTRFPKEHPAIPKAARKGSRALASIWLRAMNEKITINENGQRRRITRQQAAVKQLANKAAPVTNAPSRTCSDFRRCCFPTHR